MSAEYSMAQQYTPSFGRESEDLTLEQIQRELLELWELSDQGYDIDERRFDWLIQAQEANEEYQEMMETERVNWRESIADFVAECLERMRSFVPLNIFDCNLDDLVALGLSPEIAKRLQQRQCLWLVRMGQDEIARLHESDLLGRFNSQQQHLDIIETAAVYASLPDEFRIDPTGRKREWRATIEDALRQMLLENEQDTLPVEKIRNPVYDGKQFGPVTDFTSVREVQIHKATDARDARKSFLAICKEHSIMSRFNSLSGRKSSEERETERENKREREREKERKSAALVVFGEADGALTPPPSRQETADEGDDDYALTSLQEEEMEELADEAVEKLRSAFPHILIDEGEGEGESAEGVAEESEDVILLEEEQQKQQEEQQKQQEDKQEEQETALCAEEEEEIARQKEPEESKPAQTETDTSNTNTSAVEHTEE